MALRESDFFGNSILLKTVRVRWPIEPNWENERATKRSQCLIFNGSLGMPEWWPILKQISPDVPTEFGHIRGNLFEDWPPLWHP